MPGDSYIVYHFDEWDHSRIKNALDVIERMSPGLGIDDSNDIDYLKDIVTKLNDDGECTENG
jgi:hypothetical protein